MSDPHNPERYGETWPQYKIDAYLRHVSPLKNLVVFSGGWAWHFMSPEGHTEYKHAHDHKDVDLMVPPGNASSVMVLLITQGFRKARTRFDNIPSEESFRRYEKTYDDGTNPPFRITIDFFVKDVPVLICRDGWQVVRPDVLLGFYSTIHSSKSCWAVLAAQSLFDEGFSPEDLINNPRLSGRPQ